MTYSETSQYIRDLLFLGFKSLNELSQSQKTGLVSTFICEEQFDSIFCGEEPSRFVISRFMDSQSTQNAEQLLNNLVDSIFHAHKELLQEIMDDLIDEMEMCGYVFDEHLIADNKERYRDLKASGI